MCAKMTVHHYEDGELLWDMDEEQPVIETRQPISPMPTSPQSHQSTLSRKKSQESLSKQNSGLAARSTSNLQAFDEEQQSTTMPQTYAATAPPAAWSAVRDQQNANLDAKHKHVFSPPRTRQALYVIVKGECLLFEDNMFFKKERKMSATSVLLAYEFMQHLCGHEVTLRSRYTAPRVLHEF